jgi:hypothetical protein
MLVQRNAVAAFVALLAVGSVQASSTRLQSWCLPIVERNNEKIQCQIRTDNGTALVGASASLHGGQRLKGTLERYSAEKYASAWYFILQDTGVTAAQLATMTNAVRNLVSFEGKSCVAVATYSDVLLQRAQCGARKDQVERVLSEIQSTPPTKKPPALYKSARDALVRLNAVQADRRALVILSNGANADTTVSEANVLSLAREKNIVIFALAFGDKIAGRPPNLWRLAEKTFGVGRDFTDQSSSALSAFTSNFVELLENGFVLELPANYLPMTSDLTISGRLADNSILTAEPTTVQRTTTDTNVDHLRRLILEHTDKLTMSVAAATVIIGLLLIGAALRARRRAAPVHAITADAPIGSPAPVWPRHTGAEIGNAGVSDAQSPPNMVYGWLEFLDANSTKVPITATSLRIGRHPDNDICLPNKSVHRQHAVLHKKSDDAFVIRDLGTQNGVIVNGRRGSQHDLADNDLIELGEVRLRFVANKEPAASCES